MAFYNRVLGDREIRILSLLPGVAEDEVQCSVEAVSLDSSPVYQALSYVWGDERDPQTILVDGERTNVTQNLYSALHCLRSSKDARVIWIDAICINQNNKFEKLRQIGLMGEIYSKTSKLVIYIGDSDEQTDLTFQTITSINDELERRLHNERDRHTFWQDLNLGDTEFFRNLDAIEPFNPTPWVAINSLHKRPWWTRVWTVQEVILPKGDADFHCGGSSISWLALQRVSFMLARFNFGFERSQRLILAGYSLVHSLFERPIHAQRELRRVAIIEESDAKNTLLEYLVGYYQRQCRFEQDIVFGMLGVSMDISARDLDVAPTDPVEDVFRAVAVCWVKQRKGLGFISLCQSVGKMSKLPSWVPDWTIERPEIRKIEQSPNLLQQISAMGAASRPPIFIENRIGSSVHTFNCAPEADNDSKQGSLSADGIILEVKGFTHSRVQEVGQSAFDVRTDAVFHWLSLIREPTSGKYPSSGSNLEALWRTLVTNRDSTLQIAKDDLFEAALSPWAIQLIEKGLKDPAQRPPMGMGPTVMHMFFQLAYRALAGRLFFVTDNSYMGLAPKDVQAGDRVCVLFGVEVPMVIRDRAGGGQIVIGPSYLHGIMDGEAFRQWREDRGAVETFRLH